MVDFNLELMVNCRRVGFFSRNMNLAIPLGTGTQNQTSYWWLSHPLKGTCLSCPMFGQSVFTHSVHLLCCGRSAIEARGSHSIVDIYDTHSDIAYQHLWSNVQSYDQLTYPANLNLVDVLSASNASSESWKAPSGITIMIIKGVAADWKITAIDVSTTKRIS